MRPISVMSFAIPLLLLQWSSSSLTVSLALFTFALLSTNWKCSLWSGKCPACRTYKPHYEKVARIFNGPDAAHPGIILMARVDCALKVNFRLCDRFLVDHYPTLLWGQPWKFASIRIWDGKDGEIESIKDGCTAEHLLHWINRKNEQVGLKLQH